MRPHTLRRLRQIHLYIGMFFAPMLLLFAVSGALQTFRLSETASAPGWMLWIVAIHKDQAPPRAGSGHHDHDHHDDDAPKGVKPAPRPPEGPSPLPLKILTVLMAIGLFVSTLIGVTIALNLRAARTGALIAFALGVVLPIVLLKL